MKGKKISATGTQKGLHLEPGPIQDISGPNAKTYFGSPNYAYC
jgi:hypothetical protein